ncbi:MAG: glycerate kinase type-2 family protein [Terriglobia bacterium]
MSGKQEAPAGAGVHYVNGKHLARHIFMATLARLDVERAMQEKLRFSGDELTAGDATVRITRPPVIVAIGKAASRMASALHDLLQGRTAAGIVVSPAVPVRKVARFQYFAGGHPYPSPASLAGAEAALEALAGLTPDDVVIFLISGGGSALFERPLDENVRLEDLVEFNRVLVTGGLPIEQMNVLRKHVSAVKGGRLGAAAFPARQITFYISDVPDDCPSMVASGPSMPDESTCQQCYKIAESSGILAQLPPRIRACFDEHSLEETPKPGDSRFSKSSYFCVLSNHDAVEAARTEAAKLGFYVETEPGAWDGDYQEVIERALQALDRCARKNPGRPVCLVGGGEVTCRVTGRGVGGRNLSLALYAAQKIAGRDQVVLSGATDGRDGNSPSCGAAADGHTVSRASALGLDPADFLARSDAYHFFRTLGDTLETGFTDNNVRDLRLLMSFESHSNS